MDVFKSNNDFKYFIYTLLIGVFIVSSVYYFDIVQSSNESKLLYNNGKATKAKIVEISYSKPRGYIYLFRFQDSIYSGNYGYDKSKTFLILNDSIEILFLEDNPQINLPAYVVYSYVE